MYIKFCRAEEELTELRSRRDDLEAKAGSLETKCAALEDLRQNYIK